MSSGWHIYSRMRSTTVSPISYNTTIVYYYCILPVYTIVSKELLLKFQILRGWTRMVSPCCCMTNTEHLRMRMVVVSGTPVTKTRPYNYGLALLTFHYHKVIIQCYMIIIVIYSNSTWGADLCSGKVSRLLIRLEVIFHNRLSRRFT